MQDSFTKMLFQELIPTFKSFECQKAWILTNILCIIKLKTGFENIVIEPKLLLQVPAITEKISWK